MSADRFPTATYHVARSAVADGYVVSRGGVFLHACFNHTDEALRLVALDAEGLRLVAYDVSVTP